MMNPRIVLAIAVAVVAFAAWSKLRFVEDTDHAPQRWSVEDHPALQKAKLR